MVLFKQRIFIAKWAVLVKRKLIIKETKMDIEEREY